MNASEYQKLTPTTAVYPEYHWDSYLFNGLVSEVGEFVGKAAKSYRKDSVVYADPGNGTEAVAESFPVDDMFYEMGDILWFVSQICNKFGWRIEDVMEANILKLKGRAKRGTIIGSGDSR